MDKLYKIGPAILAFQSFPHNNLWPFREWKLDSYSIDTGNPDIVVKYDITPIKPGSTPLQTENSLHVRREMYELPDGSILWQQLNLPLEELQLQFVMSPNGRQITLTYDNTPTLGIGALESLTFLIFYAFLYHQILSFHGVLIEEGGNGFLLCAPSGEGKTTHARMWRDYKNALILNGDRATCFFDGHQWMGFGTPWCGTSGEYINRQVPIKAIVILSRGVENQAFPVNGPSLLDYVLPHVLCPSWNRDFTEKMLTLLDEFLKRVPVLHLQCTADIQAVDVLKNAMENL